MSKAHILIVDDEEMVRRVLGDALARSGYTIELAGSGQEGLKRLQQPGVDLLLLDLYLGDIDGVQVMQEARALSPHLPIVMLTAHGSMSSAIAAVRYDAADYLLKPVSVDELRECVARVLKKHTAVQQRSERLKSMYQQMRTLLEDEGALESQLGYMFSDTAAQSGQSAYQAGPLYLNIQFHQVSMHGQQIEVTPSEFSILQELVSKRGAVVPCLQLVRALNTPVDDEEEARQLIRPHIARLRRKLEPDASQPRYLLSIRGVGYRWSDEA